MLFVSIMIRIGMCGILLQFDCPLFISTLQFTKIENTAATLKSYWTLKQRVWRKQSLLTSLMVIHLYLHWLSFSFVSSPLLCRWNKCVAKTISHAPSFLNRRKSHRDSDDMMFNCLLK